MFARLRLLRVVESPSDTVSLYSSLSILECGYYMLIISFHLVFSAQGFLHRLRCALLVMIAICFLPLSACLYAAPPAHTNRTLSQPTQSSPFPLCTLERIFPYLNSASPRPWVLSLSPTKRRGEVEVLLGSVSRILSFCCRQYDLLSSSRLRFLASSVIFSPYTSSVAACAGLAVSFLQLLVYLLQLLVSFLQTTSVLPSTTSVLPSTTFVLPSTTFSTVRSYMLFLAIFNTAGNTNEV